ncbi:helix-turn-helix domain-containing protein [Rhizorhabdus wittichii]|nr:helix-turn-helix domain-containing protein [Rhizorhabdus wittichii]
MEKGAMSEGADSRNVGEQLAAERARQKLDLSDVAARTRIPLRHLDAIEKGEHGNLPALPYSTGFVKSYANMLGLDGQALSRAFRDQIGGEQRAHFEPEAYEPVDPTRVPSRLLAMIALGVALLLGMGYLLLRFEGDSSDLAKLAADTVQDIRPVPARRPPPPAAVPAQPAVPTGPISVAASEDVWIKLSEREGARTYFMNVLAAGQSFTLPDDAVDPILRTGRPQSLKVLIGTTELPPVGEPDRLVRAYSLKRDALVAIATAKPDAAMPADGAANASDAGAVPDAFRSVPPIYDPAAGRADTAGPASDSDRRPRP